jgi:hypothetical protein
MVHPRWPRIASEPRRVAAHASYAAIGAWLTQW